MSVSGATRLPAAVPMREPAKTSNNSSASAASRSDAPKKTESKPQAKNQVDKKA